MASGRRVSPISRKQPRSRWGTFTTTSRRKMRSARPLWSNVYWNFGRCGNSGTGRVPRKNAFRRVSRIRLRTGMCWHTEGAPLGRFVPSCTRKAGLFAEKSTALFGEPLAWKEDQFRADGHGDDSRGFAIHLLSALQGVSVLAHGSREPELVVMETRRLQDWVRAL